MNEAVFVQEADTKKLNLCPVCDKQELWFIQEDHAAPSYFAHFECQSCEAKITEEYRFIGRWVERR